VITITRQTARRLRTVLRRSILGVSHRGAIPPLILHAEETHLRAHYRYAHLAIEFDLPGSFQPVRSVAVPLDALAAADFRGRGSDPVVIEAAALEHRRPLGRSRDPQTRV
jgi:hypothetical protein